MIAPPPRFIPTLDGEDRPGIVAAITGMPAEMGSAVEESAWYGDPVGGWFRMRIAFGSLDGRDVEARMQARAVKVPLGRRVPLDGHRTVAFR